MKSDDDGGRQRRKERFAAVGGGEWPIKLARACGRYSLSLVRSAPAVSRQLNVRANRLNRRYRRKLFGADQPPPPFSYGEIITTDIMRTHERAHPSHYLAVHENGLMDQTYIAVKSIGSYEYWVGNYMQAFGKIDRHLRGHLLSSTAIFPVMFWTQNHSYSITPSSSTTTTINQSINPSINLDF